MRSFDLVDFKVLEAHYFLNQISKVVMPEIDFIFSAFSSASRSITFSLQAALKDLDGFEVWYSKKQNSLKENPLARFFVDARNFSQKIGVVPIAGGVFSRNANGDDFIVPRFDRTHPDFKDIPTEDVYEACKEYFIVLLEIVYECYLEFGTHIDGHQYFTEANYKTLGKTIDDADEDIIGIRGWTKVDGWPDAYRWDALRDKIPGCRISDLFLEYLNKHKPHPPRPPKNPADYNGEVWIPPCLR